MTERICYRCGRPATGYASVWTATEGERFYCHGDDDETPTCYERTNVSIGSSPDEIVARLLPSDPA